MSCAGSTAHDDNAIAFLRIEPGRERRLPHEIVVFLRQSRICRDMDLPIIDVSLKRVNSEQSRGVFYVASAHIKTSTVPEGCQSQTEPR